ncbi:MAG: tetratricopeptide repeat protein, partial [Pseudomonadota bacterium]
LIVENIEYFENSPDLRSIFLKSQFDEAPYYRPILLTSFLFDYYIWGLNPLGYHITNVLLHILNTFFVYLLFRTLSVSSMLSCATAALFAAHPAQTEAIAWIAGRNDPLMFVFFLSALVFLFRARQTPVHGIKLFFYGISFGSFAAALLAKETSVIFILLLLLIDFFFYKLAWRRHKRFETAAVYCAVTAMTFFFLVLRQSIINQPNLQLTFQPDLLALQTLFAVYAYYIKILFIPINLTVSPSLLFFTFAHFHTTFFYVVVFLFGCLGAYVLKNASKEVVFGTLWIVVYLLPVSGIIWMGVPILEHRAYGASMGFCFILATFCCRISIPSGSKFFHYYKKFTGGIFIILILYSLQSMSRNSIWNNELTVWSDALKKSPSSPEVLYNFGLSMLKQNKYAQAVDCFQKALHLHPNSDKIYNSLGFALYAEGKYAEALQTIDKALMLNPQSAEACTSRGLIFKDQGNYEEAFFWFKKALDQELPYFKAYVSLGMLYYDQGLKEKAFDVLQKALKISPHNSSLYNALGLIYSRENSFEKALEHFEKALTYNSSNTEALNNIALLFINKKNFHKAYPFLVRAVRLTPDAPELHLNMGIVFFNLKKINDALAEYNKALDLKPDYADAHFNAAVAYMFIPGKKQEQFYHFKKVLLLKPDYNQKELINKIISE